MKIQHLLEYQFPKIQQVNVSRDRHPGNRNTMKNADEIESMGSGSYANVWANKRRTPHDVRKVSKTESRRRVDGFYYFMLELKKTKGNTNPYFPRFREIKVYTDAYGEWESRGAGQPAEHVWSPEFDKITYSTKMERLTHISTLQDGQEDAIIRRIFGGSRLDPKAKKRISTIIKQYRTWQQDLLGLIEATRYGLQGRNAEGQWFVKQIQDKDFIKAMKFIIKIKEKYGLHLDLHDDNIMVRQTPYGGQLVFSDPLSGDIS